MNWLPLSGQLLAQYQAMGQRFRSPSVDARGGLLMLLFVAVAGAGAFVVYRCHKWRERWKRESPNALFYEICDAHKIDAHCRKKLIRLAEENGLEHPALLFLSPGIWEREAFQEELGEDYAKAKVAVM